MNHIEYCSMVLCAIFNILSVPYTLQKHLIIPCIMSRCVCMKCQNVAHESMKQRQFNENNNENPNKKPFKRTIILKGFILALCCGAATVAEFANKTGSFWLLTLFRNNFMVFMWPMRMPAEFMLDRNFKAIFSYFFFFSYFPAYD